MTSSVIPTATSPVSLATSPATSSAAAISSMALIVKQGNTEALAEAVLVRQMLEEHGVAVHQREHGADGGCCDSLPQVDMVLAFGGDGTMVSIGRALLGRGIPLAGINFGKVGFLAELTRSTWRKALEQVLARGFAVEERMSLAFTLMRRGNKVLSGEVLNDVVVTRGKLARLVRLELAVDGRPFMVLRSDGLILSTPVGATGYSCSAGGPLLQPGLNAYVVAAICPFLSSFPPLVLNPPTSFAVTVGEAGTDLYLTLDGQETYPLEVGDSLHVHGLPGRHLVASLGMTDYFERLRSVGFVQEAMPAGGGRPSETPGSPA